MLYQDCAPSNLNDLVSHKWLCDYLAFIESAQCSDIVNTLFHPVYGKSVDGARVRWTGFFYAVWRQHVVKTGSVLLQTSDKFQLALFVWKYLARCIFRKAN
jgi:hypothetical protein